MRTNAMNLLSSQELLIRAVKGFERTEEYENEIEVLFALQK